MVQTKNAVSLLGYKTREEILYQDKVHLLKQEQERERYAARYQQAEARHQTWLQNLREGIAAAISKARGNSPQMQGNTVFGLFEGRKERA